MAKIWAKKFYASTAWKKCRAGYIRSKHGLCERCGEAKSKLIVHHKIYLSPQNINIPEITLGWDNLECLCWECHNVEHHEKYSPVKQGYKFDEQGNYIKIEGENENE